MPPRSKIALVISSTCAGESINEISSGVLSSQSGTPYFTAMQPARWRVFSSLTNRNEFGRARRVTVP